MQENIPFGKDTFLIFDNDTGQLWLKSLFGMTCGMNGEDGASMRSGLFLLCADEKRYENGLFASRVLSTGKNTLKFSQTTLDGKLRVDTKWKYHDESRIITCSYELTNISKRQAKIRRVLPRFVFSSGEYQLYSQLSRWGNENQGEWQNLRSADFILKAKAARSTVGSTPFCVLKDMEIGKAVAFHVVPKGNWIIKVRSDVASNEMPLPVVELGLSDEDLFLNLVPGQTIELPEIIIQKAPAGDIRGLAAPLHSFLNHKYLKGRGLRTPPVLYNTWLYRFTNFTLDQLRTQLKAAKKIGCECFVVDAGWFGPDDQDWSLIGDWREKRHEPFFGKMKDFANEVGNEGLRFGLWMEPERYSLGIPIRGKHPEWFPEGSTRIDLTIPEAAEYFYQSIVDIIERYGLSYIKLDFNSDVGYDESGTELYDYCRSLSFQLSKIRKRFPTLIIENCGSGGLRADLATAGLYDLCFASDNANPYETLRIRQGARLRMPLGRILNWAVIRPTPERLTATDETIKVLAPHAATWDEMEQFDLNFVMISMIAGVMGFSGDLAGFQDDTIDKIREYCEFYKGKRKTLLDSTTHLLSPVGSIDENGKWIVFQSQNISSGESLVFVFSDGASRRGMRYFAMSGLKPKTKYRVKRVFPNENVAPVIITRLGDELMDTGILVECEGGQHSKHVASLYLVRGCSKRVSSRR